MATGPEVSVPMLPRVHLTSQGAPQMRPHMDANGFGARAMA